jgi:prepilin peptidase CpaA
MNSLLNAIGPLVPIAIAFSVVFTAALVDYRKFCIPNYLTYSTIITGLVWHTLSPYGEGLATSAGGIAIGFLSLSPFFVVGGMGAGDVKLMMAVGSMLGIPLTFSVFLASSISCGFYSVYIIIARSRFCFTLERLRLMYYRVILIGHQLISDDHHISETNKISTTSPDLIPFGVMVAIGMILVFCYGIWPSVV